jgi:hypothetical protein
MHEIKLTAKTVKVTLALDPAGFRAALDAKTIGAKTIPVVLVVGDRKLTANLNPKSFRKNVAAFQAATDPAVILSGNLNGDAVESAGIQVFDKANKPPGGAVA